MVKKVITLLMTNGAKIHVVTYMDDDEIYNELLGYEAPDENPMSKLREQMCYFRGLDENDRSVAVWLVRHNIGGFMLEMFHDPKVVKPTAKFDAQGSPILPIKR